MKKRLLAIAAVIFVLAATFGAKPLTAHAAEAETDAPSPEELLGELDISGLQEYFDTMSEDGKALFGTSLREYLERLVGGEPGIGFTDFGGYILGMVGSSFVSVLPLVLSVIAVAVLISLARGMHGGLASRSVSGIADMAGIALVSSLVLVRVFGVIRRTGALVGMLKTQTEVVFPVLFTLMTALGASGSIAIYKPAVAVLAFTVTELVTTVALPMLIVSLAFSVVGNLSDGIKLEGLAKFVVSAAKWVMYTSFFLFLAFLSVQGITAAVYDSVSVRSAKFALSKYVPVIGGYLSEGFNVILAGTVLVKNAVGLTAVLMLFVSAAPVLLEVIAVSLAFRLAAAVAEPIGGNAVSKLLGSVSSSVDLLIAVIAGMIFLYFIFLVLTIVCGNFAL